MAEFHFYLPANSIVTVHIGADDGDGARSADRSQLQIIAAPASSTPANRDTATQAGTERLDEPEAYEALLITLQRAGRSGTTPKAMMLATTRKSSWLYDKLKVLGDAGQTKRIRDGLWVWAGEPAHAGIANGDTAHEGEEVRSSRGSGAHPVLHGLGAGAVH